MSSHVQSIVENGIRNLNGYHVQKPLVRNEAGEFYTEDLKLLYFYHNRLNGYELHRFVF